MARPASVTCARSRRSSLALRYRLPGSLQVMHQAVSGLSVELIVSSTAQGAMCCSVSPRNASIVALGRAWPTSGSTALLEIAP